MSEKEVFCINTPLNVTGTDAFLEASGEELRVLIAVLEVSGQEIQIDSLAQKCKISKARARSALVFWEEAGIVFRGCSTPTITEEFEKRLQIGEIHEDCAKNVAEQIRSSALADMINECAQAMNRSALNTREIKDLTALYTQYALSEEYIVMLAAHLAEGGKLTVTKLINKAISLSEREIDTPRALEEYIAQETDENEAERSFRKIFGIYNRALSKTEKEHFKKWGKEFGYYTEIVGEAYDIAVTNVNRGHLSYVDKLLTRWYESGCRTLKECIARYEADGEEMKAKKEEKKQKKKTEPKERFGDFDVEDAFQRALDRSYGTKK